MPSTLITSPNSVVNMINISSGAGLYWNVGNSATIDTNTTFLGNILASASITMDTTATDFCGRALASTGAVTLQQNSLSGNCSGILAGSGGLNGGLDVSIPVPAPPTLPLLVLGLAGVGLAYARRRKSTAD